MAKRNLAELVGHAVADNAPITTTVPDYQSPDLPNSGTTAVPKSIPRYLQLVRKDTRLREDQLTALTGLARQLSRRRQPSGNDRITENTLIRVAVDLLLNRADKLDGDTEDELLKSVSETAGGIGT